MRNPPVTYFVTIKITGSAWLEPKGIPGTSIGKDITAASWSGFYVWPKQDQQLTVGLEVI
jgi:hypothetical protein